MRTVLTAYSLCTKSLTGAIFVGTYVCLYVRMKIKDDTVHSQIEKNTDRSVFPATHHLFLMVAEGGHAVLLHFPLIWGWKPPHAPFTAYERAVRSSTGKVITLLFSLSSITGSVKPKRQADRAVTGPLIWQLLHITKQRAPITSKWRERGTSGERLTLPLCSAISAGIFIGPLTCCTPGTFRGRIQVAKEEVWVEGSSSEW